jgi:hypothetical protein
MNNKKQINRSPEAGLALISLVFVMLVLGVVAYTFVSIISTHRYGFGVTESSIKAFYIKEGAFELGQKYIKDLGDPDEYYVLVNYAIFIDEPMGDGTFSVWVTQTDVERRRYSEITATANVPY